MSNFNNSVVLLDIEGTTTSIHFVKNVLFPYVRNNLSNYLKNHWGEDQLITDIEALRQQALLDIKNGVDGVLPIANLESDPETIQQSVLANVMWQMDLDRKTTSLKQLQGHMWREAYKTGLVCGHIYDDVIPALDSWLEAKKSIYIYSSGSVEAQKLLFGHTEKGNILKYISGHFDTAVGPKIASDSYKQIAQQIGCNVLDMLFLTDMPKEAIAAKEAGVNAILVEREGNLPLTPEDKKNFNVIQSFLDLSL